MTAYNESLSEVNHLKLRYIKVKDRYFKYSVYEHGEVKTIADMLAQGCNGNDFCEINNDFNYVMKLPYKESQIDRDPSAVINQHGGDCDEKAYLLISLLRQHGHKSILIFTKEHAFVAINVRIDGAIEKPFSYLSVRGEKYYYAETAADGSYVGWFNNITLDQFDAVYDTLLKKEIPLDEVTFSQSK
ncbi:MAG: hypothetical protein PHO27_08250 [Sulfuricurvum sp.]|nr:hypothetical protein [Sulfuricurvum sp.]